VTIYQSRTHWQVTWSVWQALFIREFLTRIAADRLAWFWMLFEPIAFIVIMIAIRTLVIGRNHYIEGAAYIPWLLIGLLGFFLFRENMMRSIGSIEANERLFTYRQVKPVDPVLVRCFVEGILKTVILFLFVAVMALLGIEILPDAFLGAVAVWLGLWLLGAGAGLILSTASRLVPEVGKIVRITTLPLLIISGAIIPLNYLPQDILAYLLWNPVTHGLELLRSMFVANYRPLDGTDALYFVIWTVLLVFVGLVMHLRFESRLKAQ
jgi:capsular polysaccharide transport system permease protein